ncbi:MAG: sulfatase, partial [Paenibacillus sp.]|nr:sulfatase [Paenibacillus sp.]
SIRTHDWKLNLYANGEGELYDLKNDPHELVNLFDRESYTSIRTGLERKLLLWTMAKEDRLPLNNTVKLTYESMKQAQIKS